MCLYSEDIISASLYTLIVNIYALRSLALAMLQQSFGFGCVETILSIDAHGPEGDALTVTWLDLFSVNGLAQFPLKCVYTKQHIYACTCTYIHTHLYSTPFMHWYWHFTWCVCLQFIMHTHVWLQLFYYPVSICTIYN